MIGVVKISRVHKNFDQFKLGQTNALRIVSNNRKQHKVNCTQSDTANLGGELTKNLQQYARQLIIAVDDTPDSLYACDWAVKQVYRDGDFIHLLHGSSNSNVNVEEHPFGQKVLLKEAERDKGINPACVEILQNSGAQFQVQIFGQLEIPSVSQAICDIGRDLNASMIIMSCHQKGFLQELFKGSHTNYCIHHSKNPVVVLHPPDEERILQQKVENGNDEDRRVRKIALAVDSTDSSIELLEWAMTHFYRENDVFHLIHIVPDVVPHPDIIGGFECKVMDTPSLQFQEEYVNWTQEYIRKNFMPMLDQKSIKSEISVVSQIGVNNYCSVGYLICKKCEEIGASALLIRSHNKGPLHEFFMGSVSSFCTHNCKDPVVVLH
eukprot:TRINITY_DN11638_c0_g2_i2.p1 TRINITY_DN11638_c0_g2~~TRINITY_DN11638_c0_g2_i2.p1  ORF type:complete len:379 (+),score=49.90 TRINITY_DN11638_c0_g2_i2:128-1264(+)